MREPARIPSRYLVSTWELGKGRSAVIRGLYVQRCNVTEITLALNVTSEEVHRALRTCPGANPSLGKCTNERRSAMIEHHAWGAL